MLQGPAFQRQASSMQLTMAVRVQQSQVSEPIGAAFTFGDAMVDMPPRFLRDQVAA